MKRAAADRPRTSLSGSMSKKKPATAGVTGFRYVHDHRRPRLYRARSMACSHAGRNGRKGPSGCSSNIPGSREAAGQSPRPEGPKKKPSRTTGRA